MSYYNKFSGKKIDRPRWKDFGTPNGTFCDVCGTECVDRCLNCGAPQCCPRCCEEGDSVTKQN